MAVMNLNLRQCNAFVDPHPESRLSRGPIPYTLLSQAVAVANESRAVLLLSNDKGQVQDAQLAWGLRGCPLRDFPWQEHAAVLQQYFHHSAEPPRASPRLSAAGSSQPAHSQKQGISSVADTSGACGSPTSPSCAGLSWASALHVCIDVVLVEPRTPLQSAGIYGALYPHIWTTTQLQGLMETDSYTLMAPSLQEIPSADL